MLFVQKSLRDRFIDFLLATNTVNIYQFFTRFYKRATINHKIANYIQSLAPGQELRVIFGAHWSNNPGWLILKESDQDITKKLHFADSSVDVIFTEHVIEHLDLQGAVNFLKESQRILKSGGVFRVVCPMLDVLLAAKIEAKYVQYEVKHLLANYSQEDYLLRELGTEGIRDFTRIFLLNDVFMNHGHKFIWTAELMVKVLQAVGFGQVVIRNIGEGVNADYCLERRCRSIYTGSDWQKDRNVGINYDTQSLAIEAIK